MKFKCIVIPAQAGILAKIPAFAEVTVVLLILAVFFSVTMFFLPAEALAQKITLDLGDNGAAVSGNGNSSITSRIVQLVALVTIIPLAPSILLMVTSFTRIIIVLSLLRTALGLQTTPPNQVLVSLALFLTMFIMAPVFEKAYFKGAF